MLKQESSMPHVTIIDNNLDRLRELDAMLDIEAVEGWMHHVVEKAADRVACLSALPRLQHGEAFAITTGAGAVPLCKFMTRPKETFDSSRTPTMDAVNLPVPDVSQPPPEVIERVGRALGLVVDEQHAGGSTRISTTR